MLAAGALLLPGSAVANTGSNGGTSPDDPAYRPGPKAKLVNGRAVPPQGAPERVVRAIEAANRIVGKPYRLGGGHARIEDSAYDCSGTVSYVLHHAGLLKTPRDSRGFLSWGRSGKGKWFTVYSSNGHAYIVIAGLRLDTSAAGGTAQGQKPGRGPRWRKKTRPGHFRARHAPGW